MTPQPLKMYEKIYLTWVDSNFSNGWHPPERQTASMPLIETFGFITFVSDDLIEVSGSRGEEGAKLNPISIPWVSIVKLGLVEVIPYQPMPVN